ncbi:hypothetical protein OUZ56_025162 [Daphnia magna]|uniref:Uncharacterized protein n=1 Tax=Daphnia magna TaxID=35525 RepID=A0ABQ9ZJ11_9CRUS|nr:hypothetical protein OUZ56_025162 [Daphnia magna]
MATMKGQSFGVPWPKNTETVAVFCNALFPESNSSEAWTQPAIDKEMEKRIRQICDEIRVLEERKLNLPCSALLLAGILAQ